MWWVGVSPIRDPLHSGQARSIYAHGGPGTRLTGSRLGLGKRPGKEKH